MPRVQQTGGLGIGTRGAGNGIELRSGTGIGYDMAVRRLYYRLRILLFELASCVFNDLSYFRWRERFLGIEMRPERRHCAMRFIASGGINRCRLTLQRPKGGLLTRRRLSTCPTTRVGHRAVEEILGRTLGIDELCQRFWVFRTQRSPDSLLLLLPGRRRIAPKIDESAVSCARCLCVPDHQEGARPTGNRTGYEVLQGRRSQ